MSPDPTAGATAMSFTPLAYRSPTIQTADGYSAGYSSGWAAGTRAAARQAQVEKQRAAEAARERAERDAAEVGRALQVLRIAAEAARERTAPVLTESQETLARAAVELAEALLGAELSDGSVAARAALSRALSLSAEEEPVRVRLNPADLADLGAQLGTLPGGIEVPPGVELLADPHLERGDAVSELAAGYLDARLTSALARARAALGASS